MIELYITSYCSGCRRLVAALGGEQAIRDRGQIVVHNLQHASTDEIAQARARNVTGVPALFENGQKSVTGPQPVLMRLRQLGVS